TRGVVEVKRKVTDVLHEIIQLGIARVNAAILDDSVAHVSGKLVAQGSPRYADDGELVGQEIVLAQMEERRQQLALGQIAGSAKDHQNPRFRNSFPAVRNLGKILRPYTHLHRRHYNLRLF